MDEKETGNMKPAKSASTVYPLISPQSQSRAFILLDLQLKRSVKQPQDRD